MGLVPQHHNKKDKDIGKRHMVGYMEELSVTEAENLKTISAFYKRACFTRFWGKYDPVTLTPRDNSSL